MNLNWKIFLTSSHISHFAFKICSLHQPCVTLGSALMAHHWQIYCYHFLIVSAPLIQLVVFLFVCWQQTWSSTLLISFFPLYMTRVIKLPSWKWAWDDSRVTTRHVVFHLAVSHWTDYCWCPLQRNIPSADVIFSLVNNVKYICWPSTQFLPVVFLCPAQ